MFEDTFLGEIIIVIVVIGLLFLGGDYLIVKTNVKYSIECKNAGMTYQKVDTIWICK